MKNNILNFISKILFIITLVLFLPNQIHAKTLIGDPGWEATDDHFGSTYSNIIVKKGKQKYNAYCYNGFILGPEEEIMGATTKYERFGFYDGMNNLSTARGDKLKIDRAASVLAAGYPNDFLNLELLYGKISLDTAKSILSGAPWQNIKDFVQDATQVVLWSIDESPIPKTPINDSKGYTGKKPIEIIKKTSPYKEIFNTPYSQTLYNYAINHPLNINDMNSEKISIININKKPIDKDHPLLIKNGKSESFELIGYTGVVDISNNTAKVYDLETNKKVNTIEANKKYYLEIDNNKIQDNFLITGNYFNLNQSYFWEPTEEPFPLRQNLVYLDINKQLLNIPCEISKKVIISKQNISGEEIAGAKLTLTTNGKEVDSWTSETGKDHEFFVEKNKEYTLTEKQAPLGYEIAESITFRVTEKGKVEIKNGNKWKELKDNKVIMIDKYKKEKSTEKLNDKKDLGLIVTDNSNNFDNSPYNNNGNEEESKFELSLPQTGNKQIKYLPVIGGILLVITIFGLMLELRRKQK